MLCKVSLRLHENIKTSLEGEKREGRKEKYA